MRARATSREGKGAALPAERLGRAAPLMMFIIPTRSCQAYSKRICLWDLAQSICIVFIIQIVWAI